MTKNRITERHPQHTLIVFDKDGVLLDLKATWLSAIVALGAYLESRCSGTTTRDEFLAVAGVVMTPETGEGVILDNSLFAAGTFEDMRRAWEEIEPSLKPIFADQKAYRAEVAQVMAEASQGNSTTKTVPRTVPMGAAVAGIKRLKSAGYRLAVATNDTHASAMANLADLGIDAVFDVIIAADSGFGSKPGCGGLLEACRSTGIAPEASIMVGDTATDYLAAVAAEYRGFITISPHAPHKPDFIPRTDFVTDSVDGLADWLEA